MVTIRSSLLPITDSQRLLSFYMCAGGFGLSGTFPEGIILFPFLEEIRLGHGNLQGLLPKSIALMKHLVQVDLQHNSFTGTIPDTWNNTRSWQYFDIRGNRIPGTISTSISRCVKEVATIEYKVNKIIIISIFDTFLLHN